MSIELIALIMFVSLVVLLLTGLPLVFVLGGLAMVFSYFLWGPNSMLLVALQVWRVMTTYSFVAIPLYIFMAVILQRSGVIEDLFTVMRMWFGPLRGGLAIGTVVICTLMAAMTGIVGAAVATMGILALPAMLNRKYDKRIALGCICAGGTLGILIPPSVITVVYAVTAGVSIGRMFMGGVGPGLLLAALFIIYIAVRCWLRPDLGPAPSKEERQEYSFIHKLLALRAVILPMILIIGVLRFGPCSEPLDHSHTHPVYAYLFGPVFGRDRHHPAVRAHILAYYQGSQLRSDLVRHPVSGQRPNGLHHPPFRLHSLLSKGRGPKRCDHG